MLQRDWIIVSNERLTEQVWQMSLAGDTTDFKAGQFVEVEVPDFFLRRPISVCNAKEGLLTLIYKVVGGGTKRMTEMKKGEKVSLLAPLGNGYNLCKSGDRPLLTGGGVGVPPLYMLARCLREQGKQVKVVLGFNTGCEVFYENAFKSLGCEVELVTMDGSYGLKGVVTDYLNDDYSYYYACGPKPMLTAVIKKLGVEGEVSMEERMGCGFGVCMGCSIETTNGAKRVCKDGPVFESRLIVERS